MKTVEQPGLMSLRYITNDVIKSFPVTSVKRVKQNTCEDLLRVGSQKSKAKDPNALSYKLTNLIRPVSNKDCQAI